MYARRRSSSHRPTADPRPLWPTDRNQRIKDARGEATKEIEELKAKKDAEFKQFENHVRSCHRVRRVLPG